MNSKIFLKFDGPSLGGSSQVKGQEGATELDGFSHAWDRTGDDGAAKAGAAVSHGTLNVTMDLDPAFAGALRLLWSGKHIEKGTLTCYRVNNTGGLDGVPYLKIELEAIVITHLDMVGGPSTTPKANMSVSYDKISYTVQAVSEAKGTSGGAKPVSHDLRTNVVA